MLYLTADWQFFEFYVIFVSELHLEDLVTEGLLLEKNGFFDCNSIQSVT